MRGGHHGHAVGRFLDSLQPIRGNLPTVNIQRMEEENHTTAPTEVYATTQSGRRSSNAVADSAARLGFESTQTRPPADHAVEFVDFPFTDESATFDEHLAVVEREQPAVAVAPDIEAGRDPATVYDQADQLAEHAETVVVVPKAIPPTEVPDRFRVGVPLANFGSDDTHRWVDYRDAGDLHLLGGSPTLQLEAGRYLPGVRSVDGASVFKGAEMGNVWAPTRARNWHPTGDRQMGYYERVRASLDNIVRAWADQAGHPSPVDGPMVVPEDPEAYNAEIEPRMDEIERDRAYREAGARGAPATVDAADADLWGPGEIDEHHMEIVDWSQRQEDAEAEALEALRDEFTQIGLDDVTDKTVATDGGEPADVSDDETDMSDDNDTYDPTGEWAEQEAQSSLFGGRADDQIRFDAPDDEGDPEIIEAVDENEGGILADTRDLDDDPDPEESRAATLGEVTGTADVPEAGQDALTSFEDDADDPDGVEGLVDDWTPERIASAFDVQQPVAEQLHEMADHPGALVQMADNGAEWTEFTGIGETSAKKIRAGVNRLEAKGIDGTAATAARFDKKASVDPDALAAKGLYDAADVLDEEDPRSDYGLTYDLALEQIADATEAHTGAYETAKHILGDVVYTEGHSGRVAAGALTDEADRLDPDGGDGIGGLVERAKSMKAERMRPIPDEELEGAVFQGFDRRQIPDSGLSLSDITDWPYLDDEREDPERREDFSKKMGEIYGATDDGDGWADAVAYLREHYGDDYQDRIELSSDLSKFADEHGVPANKHFGDEGVTQPLIRFQDFPPEDAYQQIDLRAGEDDAKDIRKAVIAFAEAGASRHDTDDGDVYDPTDETDDGEGNSSAQDTDADSGQSEEPEEFPAESQAVDAGEPTLYEQLRDRGMPGNGAKALSRRYDSMEEIEQERVGEIYEITGVGAKAMEALVPSSVDYRTKKSTIEEIRQQHGDEPDDTPHLSDGFEVGDRVEHKDGRTGTVQSKTTQSVTVEYDATGERKVTSPMSLTVTYDPREQDAADTDGDGDLEAVDEPEDSTEWFVRADVGAHAYLEGPFSTEAAAEEHRDELGDPGEYWVVEDETPVDEPDESDAPASLGPWNLNDVDPVDGGDRYHYVGGGTSALILPDGDRHRVVIDQTDAEVASDLALSEAFDLLREEETALADGTTVDFGTLNEANNWRDEHPDAMGPADTRRTKTVTLAVGLDAPAVAAAEEAALASKSSKSKNYGQSKLTDAERSRLEDRSGWTWGTHGFHAMSVKAMMEAEGVSDWTSHYQADLSVDEHRSTVLETAIQDGGGSHFDDGEMDEGEIGREIEKAKGEECSRAVDACEEGEGEACEALLEDCGYSESEIDDLRAATEEIGETFGNVYDPTTEDSGGQSFEEWAAANEPDAPEPTDDDLAQIAPTSTPAELSKEARRTLAKSWAQLRNARQMGHVASAKAEKAASVINGVRAVHGQEPIEFRDLPTWEGGEEVSDDPADEYPGPDGSDTTLAEAAKNGTLSTEVQARIADFGTGDTYDPTTEF